jgi:hypothetical protein
MKEQLQRSLDAVHAPAADLFLAISERLGPVVDFVQRSVRWNVDLGSKLASDYASVGPPSDPMVKQDEPKKQEPLESEIDRSATAESPNDSTSNDSLKDAQELDSNTLEETPNEDNWNKTESEDLIILARDDAGETTVLLLDDVLPTVRLLALPESISFSDSAAAKKVKLPYRLRLARGGLVITSSLVVLGAVPPAYRSLRFILDYPRTAEVVFIALVGSVAYCLWSWASSSKIEQERLIAAAIQSRLAARNEAAIAYLGEGACDNLTHIIMEEYVSRLVAVAPNTGQQDKGASSTAKHVDPLVSEIALSVGLFEPKGQADTLKEEEKDFAAVKWDDARLALVRTLAGPPPDKK